MRWGQTSQFSCSVLSNSLQPHGLQHTRLPCPSPTPRTCSNSCPSSQWSHPTILSSVVPFSSCLQSFPASESFPVSQFFTSGGQSLGVSASASVLPMNIQDWFPLGWTENQLTETTQILFSDPHSGLPFRRHSLFDHCWFSSLTFKVFIDLLWYCFFFVFVFFCLIIEKGNYYDIAPLWHLSPEDSFEYLLKNALPHMLQPET